MTVLREGQSLCPPWHSYDKVKGCIPLFDDNLVSAAVMPDTKEACESSGRNWWGGYCANKSKAGQLYDPCGKNYIGRQRCEVSARPPEITPVLDEHITPPPAIISTPTVIREEPKILGMPRKTAMAAGAIGTGLLLFIMFR